MEDVIFEEGEKFYFCYLKISRKFKGLCKIRYIIPTSTI